MSIKRLLLPIAMSMMALFIGFSTSAQTTITTTFANNNGNALVTFNFVNNGTTPVIITEIGSVCGSSGSQTVSAYYKPGAINGSPGAISAANGWIQFGSGTITGIANSSTTTAQTFFPTATSSLTQITIPGGTTYGLAVSASNLQYSTLATGTYTVSGGSCDIVTGTNIGYGGSLPPAVPGNHPRGFIGYVTYIPAVPCTGAPAAGSTVLSTKRPCPGNSVTVSLAGGTTATGMTYQLQSSTNNTAFTNVGTASASPMFSVAPPLGTTYYRVVSTCTASGSSSNSTSDTVIASSAISTFPWNDGIESVTTIGTNNFPSCWRKVNGTWASADASTYVEHDPRNGNRYLTVDYSAFNDVIMTPGFQLTAGTSYDFSFYWAGDDYDGWEGSVGVNTTQDLGTGATMLGSNFVNFTDVTPLGVYTKVTRTFVPTTTGVYYFGVMVNSNYNPYYLGFDDFAVNLTPSCVEPGAITTSTITSSGATINWTAPTPAPGLGYRYEVRSSGAAGSGATGLVATGTTAAGVTSATVSGLAPTSTYSVYVRSRCSASDSSAWASGTSFTTPCVAITTLPWNDGIESVTTIGTNNFPACWRKINGTWRSADAAFTSYNDPLNGSRYLTVSYSAVNDVIVTPGFQLTAGTSYDFSFYWAGDGYTGWEGSVGVNTSQNLTGATMLGSNFVNLTTTTPLGTYAKVTRTFVPTTTGVYYFGVMVNSNGNPWYLGFDDFSVRPTPSCVEPTGLTVSTITSNGAALSWTPPTPAPALGYRYEIRSSGAAGSGATGLAATGTTLAGVTSATVSTLNPQTTYSVYVRSRCSASDSSAWTMAQSFTTACVAFNAPFYESFNNGTLPTCWTNGNSVNSTSSYMFWQFSGAPGYGATNNGRTSGTYAWVDASSPSSDVVMLTSPIINLSGLTTTLVKFDWFKNNRSSATSTAPSGYPNNNLKLEGYNGTSWVTLFDDTSNATTWRTVNITLPSAFNGITNARFRFSVDKSLSNYFYDDVLLDSFSVYSAPACAAPTALTATATSSTSATLSWTAATPPPANGYEYEVRASGAAGSGSAGLDASGTTLAGVTTASVGTLNPATTYSVYVRSVCGGTLNSAWTAATTLTTPCAPVVVNLGNDTAICAGSSLSLNAGNAGAAYLWSNGATTQNITVSTAGSYSVRVTTTSGCIGRDTVNVTVNPTPLVNLGRDTAICAGSSLSLSAGNAGASYLWSNGATTQSITVSTAGSYSVRVTNASGCIGRDTINVTTNALPVVNLGRDTAICAGSSLNLNAGNAGASYLWSNGSTAQSITVTTAGSYSVRVTNASGCIGRDTINVMVNSLPVAGTITVTGQAPTFTFSVAGTSGAAIRGWRFGDGAVDNALNPTHTYMANGTYTVTYFVANGCGADSTSTTVTVNSYGVNNVSLDGQINLFPNPAADYVMVQNTASQPMKAIRILSVNGALISEVAAAGSSEQRLSVSHLAAGTYLVRIELADGSIAIKRMQVKR